ncbi:MAG: MBL fold metallo-hydrolase, partial [bacterium]
MKNKKRIYWMGFWCVIGLSALFYYVGPENIEKYSDDSAPKLAVRVLDVGQGDAIFIETPEKFQILIDGGPDKSVLYELGNVMGFWDRTIDAIVLTHPHADHVSGLVEVLRRYEVNKIYMTGVLHTSNDYITFLNLIDEKNIDVQIVDEQFVLNLDNEIDFEFLYPLKSFAGLKVESLNNTSIVNRL